MKHFIIATVLGLALGWIASLAIGGRREPSPKSAQRRPPQIDGRTQISAPPAATAISALNLNDQRRANHEGRIFNPYRQELFSRDLLESLNTEQLIEAFLAGQIQDEIEIGMVFRRIAQLDPLRALELLPEVSGVDAHKSAESSLFGAWAEADAEGLLAYALTLPDTEQKSDIAYGLAMKWVWLDPVAAMKHLDKLRGMAGVFKERLVGEMLTTWTEMDLEGAEQWVENKSDPAQRDQLRDELLTGHMRNLQGKEAVDFVQERADNAKLQQGLTLAYQSWAMVTPQEALEHFVTNPKDHAIWREIEQMGRAAMMNTFTFNRGDVDEVIAMKDLVPEGEARRQFLLGVANSASSNDLEAAEKVIALIPESRERSSALGMFTELYMRKDPVALSKWLTAQEPSPSRDDAVSTFSRLLIESDPERAREWAETIEDDRKRKWALEEIR